MFPRNMLSNPLRRSMCSSSSRFLSCTSILSSSKVNKADLTEMASQTDASELHPLPKSVRSAGQPSSDNSDKVNASSRPSHPGPSAPTLDPNVAAPNHSSRVNNGVNGNGNGNGNQEDWATSFSGMSQTPFDQKTADVLGKPIDEQDIEVKPGE